MTPGRVVIINGTSSAGKTSLVEAFKFGRAGHGELWLSTGIDDYIAQLPVEWMGLPVYDGVYRDDGMRLDKVADDRIEIRVGPVWDRLARAYRRTVALWAHHGFDVIVDDVFLDADVVDDWRLVLEGLDVLWVAVRCDPAVAERREAARGDRFIGLARGQADVVHRHATYDLELDTTSTPIEELASRLEQRLGGSSPPM